MASYLVRRLLAAVPILLGISLIAFLLGAIAPGDPAVEALKQGGTVDPDPHAVAVLRARWGLDQPLPVQYIHWLGRVVRGDLGTSYLTGQPVATEIANRLPATILLAVSSIAVAVVFGIPLGVLSAGHANRASDHLTRVSAMVIASMPSFFLGILLIALLAEKAHLLPSSGYGTPAHLILPAFALGSKPAVSLMRVVRSSLLDVWTQDFMRTAYAKGLSARAVALRHGLPNALIPAVTILGLSLGGVLGGAAIVETVFAWPGLGRFAVDAIFRRDFPSIQGFVLMSGVTYTVMNLLVDVLYHRIDPRIRLGAKSHG